MLIASCLQLVAGSVLLAAGLRLDLQLASGHPPETRSALVEARGGAPAEPIESIELVRVRLPTIYVDLPVEASVVEDGAYSVPWAALGHHLDSPEPGAAGNAVLVGHALHLPLGRLQVGDPVELVGSDGAVAVWRVAGSSSYTWEDASFIDPDRGGPPRVTLYTCEGAYDWRSGQYARRRAVLAAPPGRELELPLAAGGPASP